MKKARAHHYLPIFYLKGFTSPSVQNKGWLWVYEKNRPARKSKPINEAHQRDFYSFEDENGEVRDVEQPLAEIESEVAPLFRAIDEGYHQFHPDEWKGLTLFMALLWARGPAGKEFVNGLSAQIMKSIVRKHAEDEEQFKAKYEEFVRETHSDTKLSAADMRAFMLGNDWEVSQESHGYSLRKMFEGTLTVGEILQGKSWEVLTTDGDQFFCASDFPIVTILPGQSGKSCIGVGLEVPGVHVFFPLTKRHCLILRDRANRVRRPAPGRLVREVNKYMMVGARRFIYSCERNEAIEALFNKIGCKSVPGQNAFMRSPSPE